MKHLNIFFGNLKKNVDGVSRYILAFSFVLFASTLAFVINTPTTEAQDTGIPFGGLSTYIHYCTCTGPGVVAITVLDLSTTPGTPPNYVYYPGVTYLHPEYNIYSPGVWLLGNRQFGGSCRYFVGKFCVTWPTDGMMVRVGTSQ